MSDKIETQARIRSIEALVREADEVSDPAARRLCRELVQAVMDLHGAGFERTLEIIHRSAEKAPQQIIDEMGRDPLVRSLLLLHGLHPVDLQTRVLEGAENARSQAGSQISDIQVLQVTDSGAVALRVEGKPHGCATQALRALIEDAIYEAAPDVTSLVIEGLPQDRAAGAFVPLTALKSQAQGHGANSASEENDGVERAVAGKSQRSAE